MFKIYKCIETPAVTLYEEYFVYHLDVSNGGLPRAIVYDPEQQQWSTIYLTDDYIPEDALPQDDTEDDNDNSSNDYQDISPGAFAHMPYPLSCEYNDEEEDI